MPLISVMIPCRNGEPFVEAACRSVLDQDVDLELIFVDDGSTDGSRQIVQNIQDPRLRIIDGPRTGLAGVTNAALAVVRGEYFARCDADDLYTPGRLASQLRWLESHPEFGAICGRFDMMTRAGQYLTTAGGGESPEDCTHELREGITRTTWNSWLFRTDAVKRVGGCRSWFALGDDLDLMMRFSATHRVWYEPAVGYRYRLHEGTASHTMPNNLRLFYEDQARRFIKQRVRTGTDDLHAGHPPPLPAPACAPYYASQQIQNILIGEAWRQHQAGRKMTSLFTAARACCWRPNRWTAWRSLLVQLLKPSRTLTSSPGAAG